MEEVNDLLGKLKLMLTETESLTWYIEVHLKFQHLRNWGTMWGHPVLYSEFQVSLETLAK